MKKKMTKSRKSEDEKKALPKNFVGLNLKINIKILCWDLNLNINLKIHSGLNDKIALKICSGFILKIKIKTLHRFEPQKHSYIQTSKITLEMF